MNSINSLQLNDDELNMIEEMSSTGFLPEEIAEVLQCDEEAFLTAFASADDIVHQRYRKGYLLASLKLRQRIFKDAGHGSSPAQTLAKKILDDADFKNAQR